MYLVQYAYLIGSGCVNSTCWHCASSDRRNVGEREALVPFISIIGYSGIIKPWDVHYYTQNCKENSCAQNRAKYQVKQGL
jgi:hypothetical protein